MIGALAYFHSCRLYMGAKLGADIDAAMRLTLDTIWGHFVEGGFEHDAAWNCDLGNAVWCAFPSNDVTDTTRVPGFWTADRTGALGYNPGHATQGDAEGNYTNDFGGTSSAVRCRSGRRAGPPSHCTTKAGGGNDNLKRNTTGQRRRLLPR